MTLSPYIDHTNLTPGAQEDAIRTLCQEAIRHKFAAVCVSPCWAELACRLLTEHDVASCTVVGFPHGSVTLNTKVTECSELLKLGIQEVDMVINRSSEDCSIEVRKIAELCQKHNAILKVILESGELSPRQIEQYANQAIHAGANFLKTSTGFAKVGARLKDVALLKKLGAPHGVKVKASGGIRSKESALKFIEAGADRIGASASINIIQGQSNGI